MAKQIHMRLTDEQVQAILKKYVSNELGRVQAMDMLGLGRSRFFEWVKRYVEGWLPGVQHCLCPGSS